MVSQRVLSSSLLVSTPPQLSGVFENCICLQGHADDSIWKEGKTLNNFLLTYISLYVCACCYHKAWGPYTGLSEHKCSNSPVQGDWEGRERQGRNKALQEPRKLNPTALDVNEGQQARML